VLDDTEVLSSFPVSVVAVVSCTTVKDGVGVGDGGSRGSEPFAWSMLGLRLLPKIEI
jgi:hypothetical protein